MMPQRWASQPQIMGLYAIKECILKRNVFEIKQVSLVPLQGPSTRSAAVTDWEEVFEETWSTLSDDLQV
jgi:hypothetical protein